MHDVLDIKATPLGDADGVATPFKAAPGHKFPMLPLAALLLTTSHGGWAQSPPAAKAEPVSAFEQVIVVGHPALPDGKDSLRATTSSIGKGNQALRDIPQSVTVITEKLINDRNLDTVKDVLHNAAGMTFQAAEGGEEDIRLRGFSLATTGDIFLDGMRDAAFYDRDTFNHDRVDILRGSASMLFGRGSTGGAVNQVSKVPRLVDEKNLTLTAGSHDYRRIVADLNVKTGESAAFRVAGMHTKADSNGAGSSIDKQGVAVAHRFGIGEKNEFLASIYHLENNNGMNYGLPWIKANASDSNAANTVIGSLDPNAYFGMASDYNAGRASIATASHIFRIDPDSEIKTQIRRGQYKRDQRAGTVRFAGVGVTPVTNRAAIDLNNFGPDTVFVRGTNLKVQDLDTMQAQSDLSSKFAALGMKHHVLAGIDYSRDQREVFGAITAAQGAVVPVKLTTLAGTPYDGATVKEFTRALRTTNDFTSKAWGVYAQDLVELVPMWKLVGGLRYDNMDGRYNAYAIPAAAITPVTATSYQQKISAASYRAGLLFQPNALHSYHLSYGTSFNTSGDTYSYNAQSANTPPESSVNYEIGAKLDSGDKRFTTRLALFHSTKNHERNSDPDSAAARLLLSGKRHTAGFELDLVGRLTTEWEVFGSYMWMPIARVDIAASTATTVGNRVGDRPGLSPRHGGTVWTTYQLNPKLRVGGGVNFRSGQSAPDVTAPPWEAPSFASADLLAEYAFSDQYKLKANVSNVANIRYADGLYRGHYVPGPGRLFQLALTMNF